MTLLTQVSGLLEWQNRDKATVVAAVGLALALIFTGWTALTLQFTEFGERYFDLYYAHIVIKIQIISSIFWLLVILFGGYLRKREKDPMWFCVLVLTAYPAFLVPSGWIYGWGTLSAGLILVGSYLVGIVLWDLRLARFSVLTPSLFFGAMILLTLLGVIPYAPLFSVHPLSGDSPSIYFLVSDLLLSLPFLSVCTITGLMMIISWHEREESIRYLSLTDELTSISNRRAILHTLENELARSQRNGHPVSLAILDLDHFKNVNDSYGHDAGDIVLREAARRMEAAIRGADWLGRYGGEEFLLVMPETKSEDATHMLERCRQNLADTPVTLPDGTALQISASFGYCENTNNLNATELLHNADQALYQAKAAGRNCIKLWR